MEILDLDDEIKGLIMECLDNNVTGGADIDGLVCYKDGFFIIEFLRCVTVRPNLSHPNRYWNYGTGKTGNKQKFLSLWNLAKKTNSKLYLVNYEDNREQFKIIEVLQMNDSKQIFEENITLMNYSEFKKWIISLNDICK